MITRPHLPGLGRLLWRARRMGARGRLRVLTTRASLHRRRLRHVRFVAVTGSCGKSTTKDLITAVLSSRYSVTSTVRTGNQLPHIARTILRTSPRQDFCVLETASEGPGYLAQVLPLVRPDVGVVTAIGTDHYSKFRGPEATALEKGSVVAALAADGVAVLNADDPYVIGMRERFAGRTITCGTAETADLRALDVRSAWPDRLSFTVSCDGERVAVQTRLCGKHWVSAVLSALAVGRAFDIPLADAAAAIARTEPWEGGMQPVTLPDGVTFIRDDWKAPWGSLPITIEFLREAHAPRKILVVGTISDYPGASDRKYRWVAREALKVTDEVVFVGPNAHQLRRVLGRIGADRLRAFPTVRAASDYFLGALAPGDLVVLKGSGKADHLVRILLARTTEVRCWLAACGRTTFCSRCELLGVPAEPSETRSGVGHRPAVSEAHRRITVAVEPQVVPLEVERAAGSARASTPAAVSAGVSAPVAVRAGVMDTLGPAGTRRVFVHCVSSLGDPGLLRLVTGIGRYAERALLLARAEDVVCVTRPVDEAYLSFLRDELGVGPAPEHVVVPAENRGRARPHSVLDRLLKDQPTLQRIAALSAQDTGVVLSIFAASAAANQLRQRLEQLLQQPVHLDCVDPRLTHRVGRKDELRSIAKALGVPLAEAQVVRAPRSIEANGSPEHRPRASKAARRDTSALSEAIERRLTSAGAVLVRGTWGNSGSSTRVIRARSDMPEALRIVAEEEWNDVFLVERVCPALVSPNVLLHVDGHSVSLLGTTDQRLDAALVHQGNVFPSEAPHRHELERCAERLGRWLAGQRYGGFVGFDFVERAESAAGDEPWFLAELNPRINGVAYPLALLERLRGHGGAGAGPAAFATGNVRTRAVSFSEVRRRLGALFYDYKSAAGAVPYNVGCLELGKLSLACFGATRDEALETLERASHALETD